MNQQQDNKYHNAVALKYERDDRAPRVVAKGRGLIAEQIIGVAKDAGVPLHENAELVELLAQVELDAEIPVQLYQAVAEVLAFIYQLQSLRNPPPIRE